MSAVAAVFAWVYDFLAEDPVLVVGAPIAIVLTAIAVNLSPSWAGVVLWLVVSVTIAVSLVKAISAKRA
jgi:hypothetical protein